MLLFDIVFKSGEFYGDEGSFWKDYIIPVFTAALGAGIGAYVTYRVFRETLKADREKEARQRNEEQEKELRAKNDLESERLLYLSNLIERSINFMKNLLVAINNFRKELEAQPIEIPPINLPFTNDLKRIVYDIDRENHFHAYRNQVKDQNIFIIFSTFDYFERIRIGIENGRELTLKNYNIPKDELIKELLNLTSLLKIYQNTLKEKQSLYPKECQVVRKAIQNQDRLSTETTSITQLFIDSVVNPLSQFYYENSTLISNEYRDLGISANKIIDLSIPMIALNESYRDKMTSYYESIEKELAKIIKAYKPLSEFCKEKFPV
ncbi:hypothetical protein [Salmonirosea aquatica]|uniref:Uncharacterized protein n=1 Tax=Salmonirosea aquatica TaxID=2654236 RepID=A0A7C9FX79_9BACT|nr:hypothetical protein [Cytophagaceae bacterium SJW1-29]